MTGPTLYERPSRDVHLPDGQCWCDGNGGVSQEGRLVYKHEHQGGGACTRPWTALCQTQHGDLCHASDHPTQPEALAALCAHLAAGKHIDPGAGNRETETPCQAIAYATGGQR